MTLLQSRFIEKNDVHFDTNTKGELRSTNGPYDPAIATAGEYVEGVSWVQSLSNGLWYQLNTEAALRAATGDATATIDQNVLPESGDGTASSMWIPAASVSADSYAPLWPEMSASNLTSVADGTVYRLNDSVYRDLGETDSAITRRLLVPETKYAYVVQLNNNSLWLWDGAQADPLDADAGWTRSVGDVVPPATAGDATINPLSVENDYGHDYSDWINVDLEKSRNICLEMFGGGTNATATENSAAMSAMLRLAGDQEYSIIGKRGVYQFEEDIILTQDRFVLHGNGMWFAMNGCKFCMTGDSDDGVWGSNINNIKITRTGTPGSAFLITGSQALRFNIRWNLSTIFIDGSTGNGMQIKGSFTGVIDNLTSRGCDGAGLHMIPNADGQLGCNVITLVGGDIQNNLKGVVCTDTKAVKLMNTTVQGNKQHGIDLVGDNRNFEFDGGYLEGNAKDFDFIYEYDEVTDAWTDTGVVPNPDDVCDVKVGHADWFGKGLAGSLGDPNCIVSFSGLWTSDGGNGGTHWACLEGPQIKINFKDINFWSYASAPIRQIEGAASLATGYAKDCYRSSGSLLTSGGNQMFRNEVAGQLETVTTL